MARSSIQTQTFHRFLNFHRRTLKGPYLQLGFLSPTVLSSPRNTTAALQAKVPHGILCLPSRDVESYLNQGLKNCAKSKISLEKTPEVTIRYSVILSIIRANSQLFFQPWNRWLVLRFTPDEAVGLHWEAMLFEKYITLYTRSDLRTRRVSTQQGAPGTWNQLKDRFVSTPSALLWRARPFSEWLSVQLFSCLPQIPWSQTLLAWKFWQPS